MTGPCRRRLLQFMLQWSNGGVANQIPAQTRAALGGGLQSSLFFGKVGRGFSQASNASSTFATTNAALQQTQVHRLREDLAAESEQVPYITMQDFKQRALDLGAASSDQEAEDLCSAMQQSGLIIRHLDFVYLHAEDIQEQIMMMLPGASEDMKIRLTKVEEEIQQLDKLHTSAEKSANRMTDLILGAGGMVLFTQFVAFIYLTWWELSWDVMEPFGYIIQLFYSLLAYIYFMVTRGKVFDLKPFREFWSQKFKASKIEELKFDEGRYAYLLKLRTRYRQHLSHVSPKV